MIKTTAKGSTVTCDRCGEESPSGYTRQAQFERVLADAGWLVKDGEHVCLGCCGPGKYITFNLLPARPVEVACSDGGCGKCVNCRWKRLHREMWKGKPFSG